LSVRGTVRLPLEQLQPYLFGNVEGCYEKYPVPFVWESVFANNAAVEIEVGFGKGLFLLTASQQRPDVNFFGIDIERKCQLFTANRLAKRNLQNVRLTCADARPLLETCVPANTVQAIHVYFPDPWWKKRHHKRRLFTDGFATACCRALEDGGRLELMTDVQEYFGTIIGLLARQPRLHLLPAAERAGEYRTNFERKLRLAGKPIFGASYAAN
jgi:tRNA (guanine-N7-)-methyltransferase